MKRKEMLMKQMLGVDEEHKIVDEANDECWRC